MQLIGVILIIVNTIAKIIQTNKKKLIDFMLYLYQINEHIRAHKQKNLFYLIAI